jgi:hypothetical protein
LEYFVYFTTKSSTPAPLRCVIVNRGPRKTRKDGRYAGRVWLGLKVHSVVEDAYDFDRPPAIIGPHVSFVDRDDLA